MFRNPLQKTMFPHNCRHSSRVFLPPQEKFGVQAPYSALPCLFGCSAHLFQILYGKPFFAVNQIIVYGLQVFSLMLYYGDRGVPVPR